MDESIVKVCPECGSEFQLWVERCIDCGALLVASLSLGFEPRKAVEPDQPLPPDRVLIRTAPVFWIRALSLDLAGIQHWIQEAEPGRLTLSVLPSDAAEARRLDAIRYRLEVPDAGGGEAAPEAPVRVWREPSPGDLSVKLCPRCGSEYQLWAEKCADCGIPLVHPWELDAARQAEAARGRTLQPEPSEPDDSEGPPTACPACGERLREGAAECPGCGLVLAQPSACPSCGLELDSHVLTCPWCGESLYASPEKEG